MADVILAEDDDTLRMALTIALESEGYSVRACADGGRALAAFEAARPDLVILDVMMPVKSGYEACMEIRKAGGDVPVVFLTAKSNEEDVVLGFGLGADEFIAKPLRLKEFLARIAAVLKRAGGRKGGGAGGTDGSAFRIGTALVDANRFTLTEDGGRRHSLTVRELGLLKMFAGHPGEVLSRDQLLDSVWGATYRGTTRTLDQHIVQIRKKLGESSRLVETVRGAGYRYRGCAQLCTRAMV